MNEWVLKASGITKSFKKSGASITVLRGINFELKKGERVAIIGSSGAGKSTLLHVLGTLEKPSSGELFYGAQKEKVLKWNDEELARFRNRTMGFVFQFHHLLPEFTALENVMLPALIGGHKTLEAQSRALELLKFVGMNHRLEHRPSELSGGEQQRVAICRALMMNPEILFADELTGNLDSANTEAILDLLIRLNESMGVSILMVTHDLQLTKKMHRVLQMKDGQFV